MSYYLDCQCDTCLKREGESLGRNIVIHSIILNCMPENVVTHADYRALEEKYALVCKFADDKCEELAALRARVGELVEADRAFDVCIANQVIDDKVYDRRQAALEALK